MTFDKISSNFCGLLRKTELYQTKLLEFFTSYKIVIVPSYSAVNLKSKNILRESPFIEQTFSIFSQSAISGIEAGGGNQECNSKERHKPSSQLKLHEF